MLVTLLAVAGGLAGCNRLPVGTEGDVAGRPPPDSPIGTPTPIVATGADGAPGATGAPVAISDAGVNANPSAPSAPGLPASASPLLHGDDRSPSLRALTADWKTDWTRRNIATDQIASGGPPRDGIPPIDNPRAVEIAAADAWLADQEPVLVVAEGGVVRAYPLQVLTWHEVANDTLGGVPVAVTFCPLCNAAVAYDRRLGDRVLTFGVSGLLRNSDLIMWDRQTESLWQQLEGRAVVGALTGAQLKPLPALLISWADFKHDFPTATVLSRETGFEREYGSNPYARYDAPGSSPFLFTGAPDPRLDATERVVAVEHGGEAVAYPFSRLATARAVADTVGGLAIVVFWKPGTVSALDAPRIADSRDVGSAAVFEPRVGGRVLHFTGATQAGAGLFRDQETGSNWDIVGRAVSGPLSGAQLPQVGHASAFWFAWAAFRPLTRVWTGETGGK